jgi:hypothetical protein
MMKLTTAIARSPKFSKIKVTRVGCSNCRVSMPIADAWVDHKGHIWCWRCK